MKDDEYYELQRNGSAWTKDCKAYYKRVCNAIDALGHIEGLRVADVGCGDGSSTKYIRSKGATAWGYDVSKEKVDAAQAHKDIFVGWLDIDKYAMPTDPEGEAEVLDNMFDVVFCSHTLEHTRDPNKAAIYMTQMLKQGGKLVLIFPVENEQPPDNPSHVSWMNEQRIKELRWCLRTLFERVTEIRKHRIEDECWIICEGRL